MAQGNTQEIKLPTKANNSLRSKTVGRLSLFGGKASQNAPPKTQTWHKTAPGKPGTPDSSTRTIPRPKLTWEPGMLTVEYIQRNLPLPRVILCDHTLCDLGKGTMGFDCSQLMMMRSKTQCLKVQAGCLAVNMKDNKSLVDTEYRLIVPEDYKGWFAVLGNEMSLKAIPHYREVAQLAQSDCHTFLIGGSDNVRSVQKVGESISDSRHLCPGDILKMGTLDESEKYLHCTDENDRDILIPVEAKGMFYVMKNKSRPSKVPILQIKVILQKYKFPCIVKLVYGREPTGEGVFTRIMTLESVQQEMSVLASTVLKGKNTLHELSLDTPNKFRVAVQSKELVHNAGYISALNLCQDKGDLFMRSIKMFRHVPSSVQPRVTAMGITYASPQTSKELTRSISEPPSLFHESVKPVQAVSPSTTSGPALVKNTPATTPVSKAVDPQSVKVEKSLETTSNRVNGIAISASNDHKSKLPEPKMQLQPQLQTQPKPQSQPKTQPQSQLQQNGVTPEVASVQYRRQRNPGLDPIPPPPPPPPFKTVTFNDAAIQPKVDNQNLPESSIVKNGVNRTDKPASNGHKETVQIVSLNKPRDHKATVQIISQDKPKRSKAVRPNAYEEVWTATSGKDDSASDDMSSTTSSISDTYVQSGMGGQIITGGVPPVNIPDVVGSKVREQNIQKISVVTSENKKKQAQKLTAYYSSIDVVEGHPVVEKLEPRKSFYSTTAIVDESPEEIDDSRAQRKKRVSFSDILDVQTIPKQHVTTINIQEQMTREARARKEKESKEFEPVTKFHVPGPSNHRDVSTGPPSASFNTDDDYILEDPSSESGFSSSSSSGSTVDDLGYMIPVLDRKGRVKLENDAHKIHVEHGRSRDNLTRRISLPNMTVADSRPASVKDKRRDSETDILW